MGVKAKLGTAALVAALLSGACADRPPARTAAAAAADVAPSPATTADAPPRARPATEPPGPTVGSPTSALSPTSSPPASPPPTVTFEAVSARTDTYDVEASLPVVAGLEPSVAAAVDRSVRDWFEAQSATFAEEDLDFVVPGTLPEDFPRGVFEVRSSVGALTPELLSVVFHVTAMHQGMAHPWTVVEAFTFDLTTGRTVGLEELFVDGQDVLGTISALVVPRLVAALDPTGEGWSEAGVRAGAAADADLLRRFVVDEDGLTIHFDQYQVAPGVAGPQAVTLGWDGLLDLLAPAPRLHGALAG